MKRNLLYFRLYALLALVCFLYGAMQEARRAGIEAPPWTAQPGYWWQTPVQRGASAFAQGDWQQAMRHFRQSPQPDWLAAACYRAGDFNCAAASLSEATSPQARYNLGNIEARRGRLASALKHYDAALAARPDWREAEDNRQLVLHLIAERTRRGDPPDGDGEPNQDPDEIVTDEKGKKGKAGAIDIEKLDPKSHAQFWLRQVRNEAGPTWLHKVKLEDIKRLANPGLEDNGKAKLGSTFDTLYCGDFKSQVKPAGHTPPALLVSAEGQGSILIRPGQLDALVSLLCLAKEQGHVR